MRKDTIEDLLYVLSVGIFVIFMIYLLSSCSKTSSAESTHQFAVTDMQVLKVFNQTNETTYINRAENDEVICYFSDLGGIWCNWK